jgi:predicted ATPase
MTTGREDSSAIQTPDQRLRVFVSSTLAELADERAAVARAITSLRLSPVMFELGARPHPPQELYRAYLAQSDIFIGLYWQSYGWIGPGMEISGLEDEFRLSGQRPRLLYLKTPAPDRDPLLTAMIGEIEAQGTDAYRKFRTTRELGRLVRDDLALLLSERFATSARHLVPVTVPEPIIAAPRRRTIPVTSTELFGRQDDIATVADLLEQGGVRLVTLLGPGGIGKTRLAMAVGEEVEHRSSMLVLFVPLASVSSPELVLPRVAAQAGASMEGTRSALDTLIERFAATPILLVLDNLEQVVGVANELDELLAACPGLKILATSRTVLRLRAEREYPVLPLAVPADTTQSSREELALLPAVRLFVDRAQAVRRDFTLTSTNAAAVAEICRRLDGLPLAIELAAARTRLLEPLALLARLQSVLDALGTGPVDLPERQRTLRATVEWSVGLLQEPERQLLATLSVFADGWTVDAATAVCGHGDDQTLDLLDALAGHSLVSLDDSGRTPRFRMLTSVQELAAERLADSTDAPAVHERHARYFATLVEDSDWPAERQSEWVERLRADEENLRVAIRWLFDHDIAALPRLFRALWLFWQLSDRMPEGRAWIGELRGSGAPFDLHAQAEVLFTWAVTSVEVGDDDGGLAAIDGIRGLAAGLDDPQLASALQLAIAWTLPILDDFEGALRAASAALSGFREQNEPFVAFAALTVGMLETTFGRDDLGRQHLTEVVTLGERYGNTWLTSSARTQLAIISVRAGRLDEARALLTEALDSIEEPHVSTITATFLLVAFAEIALAEGDARLAAEALGAVRGLRERAGLLAWPITRRAEADLAVRLHGIATPAVATAADAAGAELHLRAAMALIRDAVTA